MLKLVFLSEIVFNTLISVAFLPYKLQVTSVENTDKLLRTFLLVDHIVCPLYLKMGFLELDSRYQDFDLFFEVKSLICFSN